jgi:PmbA protein
MNSNAIEVFKEKLFAAARQKGFSDWEVYYSGSSSFSVKVFEGEIREYKNALEAGLSFRGTWKGRMGYAFTERIDDDVIPFLIENAAGNAEIIEDADVEDLYAGNSVYPDVKTFEDELVRWPVADQIGTALALEVAAREKDKRVAAVDYCGIETEESERYIANSLGLNLRDRSNAAGAYVFPRVQGEDGQVKVNGKYWVGQDKNTLDPNALGREAAEKSLSYLGARSVTTGTYKVVLTGEAMGAILGTFSAVFSAEEVQKGFSLLRGKLGQRIAADVVTLRDDPLLPGLPGSGSFDSEGVASKNKAVIEGGILKTFLHNRKTARKDNVEPSGNGFKYSFKSTMGIRPANFYLAPSQKTPEDLLAEMGEGLLISDLAGLHSGADPVSGNFSVSAEGHLVSGGKRGHAVEQITIAGNFFTLLMDIRSLANDLEFHSPIASPSVLVRGLSVAGLDS